MQSKYFEKYLAMEKYFVYNNKEHSVSKIYQADFFLEWNIFVIHDKNTFERIYVTLFYKLRSKYRNQDDIFELHERVVSQ